jgi:hypothetical protein
MAGLPVELGAAGVNGDNYAVVTFYAHRQLPRLDW